MHDKKAYETKPPNIIHSVPDAYMSVLPTVVDTPFAGKDSEVLEHLQELFDETVERSKLSSQQFSVRQRFDGHLLLRRDKTPHRDGRRQADQANATPAFTCRSR